MSKQNTHHVSTNIPSARTTAKSALSVGTRTTLTRDTTSIDFIDYNLSDAKRREILVKEQSARRAWSAKYDPWLIDEYRKMYDDIAESRGVVRENRVPSLKRTEWQQPADAFPPLSKRLAGQRRRRLLGAFPQTENDKIGWRMLPEQAVEVYGSSKIQQTSALPVQYRFSHWPVESFY